MKEYTRKYKAALIAELALEIYKEIVDEFVPSDSILVEFLVIHEKFSRKDAESFIRKYRDFIFEVSSELMNIVASAIEDEEELD